MKLHIPVKLRAAVMACWSAAATLGTTVGTGVVLCSAQTWAADNQYTTDQTWTLAQDGDTTHASDTTTVSGENAELTVTRTNNGTAPGDGATFNLGQVTVSDKGSMVINAFVGGSADSTKIKTKEDNIRLEGNVILNGGTLKSNDSSFYLAGDLTVQGADNTFEADGSKSYDFERIVGSEDAVLNIISPLNQWATDNSLIRVADTEGAYAGTVNMVSNSGKQINLMGGGTNTFTNTVLNLGTNSRLLLGADIVNLKSLTGVGTVALPGANYLPDGAALPASGKLVITGTSAGAFSGRIESGITVEVAQSGSLTLTGDCSIAGGITNNGTVSFTGDVTLGNCGSITNTATGSVDFSGITSMGIDLNSATCTSEVEYEDYFAIEYELMGVTGGTVNFGDWDDKLSVSNGKLIYRDTVYVNGWDKNWGSAGLLGATNTADLQTYSNAADSYLNGSPVKLTEGGSATTWVYGGAHNSSFSGDSWIYMEGGTWGSLVGGNFSDSSLANFTGNSHLYLKGGTVNNVIGGTRRDSGSPLFKGNSYISVAEGADVLGSIIGGGTTGHMGTTRFEGNSNIFVYTVLGQNTAGLETDSLNKVAAADASIVGGNVMARNVSGTLSFVGDTNITVDLSGYTGTGESFVKRIIGGSLSYETGSPVTHNGHTNISITTSASKAISFTAAIVGGSYMTGGSTVTHNGDMSVTINGTGSTFNGMVVGGIYSAAPSATINHTGDSRVVITGGTFMQEVVAGSVMNYWSTTNLNGCASLLVEDGTFHGRVIGSALLNSTYSGTSSIISNASTERNVFMQLNGGQFNRDIVGGLCIDASNDERNWILAGDIEMELGDRAVVGSEATVYGGSYIPNVVANSTVSQQNISVSIAHGAQLNGSLYAAGSGTTNTGRVTTASTRVSIEAGAQIAHGVTISGGYENTGDNCSVTGSRTLAAGGSGEVDLSAAHVVDFDVAEVADEVTLKLADLGSISSKTGNGILQLNGASAATQAVTINAGTLATQHANALGSGAVTVASGATLQVASRSLTLGADLTLSTGATLSFAEGTSLTLNGTINITGEGSIMIDLSTWDAPVSSASLISMGSETSAESWWESYGDRVEFVTSGNLVADVNLANNSINITLATIPEPATTTLSLLALAGLCARRRRK